MLGRVIRRDNGPIQGLETYKLYISNESQIMDQMRKCSIGNVYTSTKVIAAEQKGVVIFEFDVYLLIFRLNKLGILLATHQSILLVLKLLQKSRPIILRILVRLILFIKLRSFCILIRKWSKLWIRVNRRYNSIKLLHCGQFYLFWQEAFYCSMQQNIYFVVLAYTQHSQLKKIMNLKLDRPLDTYKLKVKMLLCKLNEYITIYF